MKLFHIAIILVSASNLSAAFADEIDFKKKYSAFGEAPAEKVRASAEELVSVSLKNFKLEADNVTQAYDLITESLQATDYPYGMSLIMMNHDEDNYESPIKIPRATRTLGEVINLLCEQADLQWDFSRGKLTFKPNPKDSR